MKVVVFGSTGTIGRQVVQQSLEEGHEVLAFCRNAEKLADLSHPSLHIRTGDVFKPSDVEQAVKGQDIVCVALGSGRQRKGNVRSKGTQHVIEAMKKEGVNRLIVQSTLGAGDSHANLNFFWKHIMFGWFLKEVFLDHELQESYVMESGLDWTIVRASSFTDGEKTGTYKHGFGADMEGLKLKISRADVADFFLKQFQNEGYLRRAVSISN